MKKTGILVIDSNDSGDFLDLKVEVTRDTDGKITQGIVAGDTLPQNIAFILMAERGELKGTPELGVGLTSILLDDDLIGMNIG